MDLSRVGACTLGLRMLDLEPALDELADLGLTGVDLWQTSPYYENRGHFCSDDSTEDREWLARLVADRGLRLDHFASYPGLAFSSELEADRTNDLAWAKQTIDLCADCNIPIMRIGPGRGETLDHLDIVASLLRQATDYATPKGVRLVLETHLGLPTCRADWIVTLLESVGSETLGVLYDPGNLVAGEAYKDVPRLLGDRILHVHLKSAHLAEDGKSVTGWAHPAEGAADMTWVLEALADCGYAGNFAIEYEAFREDASVEDARAGLTEWIEFLKAS